MTAVMRPFAVCTEATSSVYDVYHHSERVNHCSLAQTLLLLLLVMLRWRMMMNVITRTNYVPRNVEHLSPPRRHFAPRTFVPPRNYYRGCHSDFDRDRNYIDSCSGDITAVIPGSYARNRVWAT